MSDKVNSAVLGAIAGSTLGAPLQGQDGYHRLAFYEPKPKRMAPNAVFDAWVLFSRRLGAQADPTQVPALVVGELMAGTTASAIAKENFSRGLAAPASGSFANPCSLTSGILATGVYWGLVYPDQPALAARWASFDAASDRSADAVWCTAAVARAVSIAAQGTSFVEIVKAMTTGLPEASRLNKGIGVVLQAMGRTDGAKVVQTMAAGAMGLSDSDDASLALTYALAGLATGKDFASAICNAAGCGGPATDSAAVAGALAAVIHGGVPEDWLEPIGTVYVSAFLPTSVTPPDSLEDYVAMVRGCVHEPAVPEPVVTPEAVSDPITSTPVAESALPDIAAQEAEPGTDEQPPPLPPEETGVEETPPAVAEPAVEAAVTTGPLPVPGPPEGEALCWIQGDLQIEVEYLNGIAAKDGQTVQLALTLRNLGEASLTVEVDAQSPDGFPVAARLGGLVVPPGGSTQKGIVVQPPHLTRDSQVHVTVNGSNYAVPLFTPVRWFAAGPFSNDDETAFLKEVPPERSQARGAVFSGRSGLRVEWEKLCVTENPFEIEPLFRSGPGVVVLFARLKFPKAGKTTVVASSSPGVVVKVDGATVVKYKDSHVPKRRAIAPYAGTFDASDEVNVLIKLIRDKEPMPPLAVYFLDSLGNAVTPASLDEMPE